MQWDLFCRVVDNHGDLGVCWRLASELAARGESVRLWVDDPIALHWMAPGHAVSSEGVRVLHWAEPLPDVAPGDVVVEAFGCDPPDYFVDRMARGASGQAATMRTPVWINLEYLSAEDYVERSHGLPSPQPTAYGGLTKWFFYPGFTPATGGLLREADALRPGKAPWSELDVWPHPGERCISLFAYADAPIAELLDLLEDRPTLLLLCAGAGQAPALAALQGRAQRHVRAHALPWLTQRDYDRLLHACDLNFARGEDSIVRAMWAGAPFVWHIYRQHDGAHERKLKAMLARVQADVPVQRLWRAWNAMDAWPTALPDELPWREACREWRASLLEQRDLTSQLLEFVASKR
jgi:uncharacterized repeat protein (TIGR03837 family)